ncbi:chemotaxis protein CheX [Aureimonas sp. SA4125]|uniref:STAS domain-containing protein n=1 Tax=Aureimonas sp. SA4125 TaxID=2826993 RepID=UPI001CC4936E|nr:STAS domain-containing protein [Aureimonas sp. SA4125]BDA82706.1 chemotaxis protein CheX [Aureimonas sp. SA4125]BDA86195.1 chemotaxis protein CheX [Aureimonas sp. SA4125]
MNDATDALVIDLPAHLDLTAAAPLAERFLAARGEAIAIDASKVERLGGQCLQVLLSAVVTWKADLTPLSIIQPSDGFESGLKLLGLSVDSLIEKEITL